MNYVFWTDPSNIFTQALVEEGKDENLQMEWRRLTANPIGLDNMRIPSYSVVNPKDSSGDGLYSRFKRTIHNAVNSKGFKNIR